MRTRTAVLTAFAVVCAGGAVSPVVAAPKPKPVKKEYTASATPGGPASLANSTICDSTIPGSTYDVDFKAPFAGRLTVKQDGFQGDWDLALVQDGGNAAQSAQDATDTNVSRPETVEGYKLKKGESITIRSCNWAGGPTAHVAYSFAG
jgi:hypothetical protein